MKIEGVWYNRPGGVYRTQYGSFTDNITTSAKRRGIVITSDQKTPTAAHMAKLHMRDYNTNCEWSNPNCARMKDVVLLPNMTFVITDEEIREKSRQQQSSAVRRQILDEAPLTPPPTPPAVHSTPHPVSSLYVRQMSPQPPKNSKRSTSANSWFKTKSRSRVTSPDHPGIQKTPGGLEAEMYPRRVRKNVSFADNLPTAKSPDELVEAEYGSVFADSDCDCWHQAMVPPEHARELGYCVLCKGHRPELFLPKIDLSTAIDDGQRRTFRNILTDSTDETRSYFTNKERAIIKIMNPSGLDGKFKASKKLTQRLSPKRKGASTPVRRSDSCSQTISPTARDLLLSMPSSIKPADFFYSNALATQTTPKRYAMSTHDRERDKQEFWSSQIRRISDRKIIQPKTVELSLPENYC